LQLKDYAGVRFSPSRGRSIARSARAAQYLNTGISPNGSSAGLGGRTSNGPSFYSSCAGLTRASIHFSREKMDCRIKSGNDEGN
jgi:hypothetical protein